MLKDNGRLQKTVQIIILGGNGEFKKKDMDF